MVAMQYLSYALAGFPYMGVGRNLSYTRTMFFAGGGFTSHYKISSGDDDLLIGQIAKKKNTRIEVSPESFIYSEPKTTFREWVKQKQRHLTTGRFYKGKFKLLLGAFSITQLLFFREFYFIVIFFRCLLYNCRYFYHSVYYPINCSKKSDESSGRKAFINNFALVGSNLYTHNANNKF